jgi:hypothetical protein
MDDVSTAAYVTAFSTADYRDREATAAWREIFGRTLLRIDITPLSETFQAEATASNWPGFGAIYASTSPAHYANSHALIANDNLSLEQRLSAAYRALTDRARSRAPISTIAYGAGFTDLSNFYRAFRQRFGCTPSDVRAAARERASMSRCRAHTTKISVLLSAGCVVRVAKCTAAWAPLPSSS